MALLGQLLTVSGHLLMLTLRPRETLSLHLVVLHELISTNILHALLVEDVLAYLLECFTNSAINLLSKENSQLKPKRIL